MTERKPVTRPELLRKLEAIQELKRQYMIGSLSAFRYHTAMVFYESLRSNLMRMPWITHCPTVREVSGACKQAQRHIQSYLMRLAVLKSTPENLSLISRHYILSASEQGIADECLYKESIDYFWRFDYQTFLANYFRHFSRTLGWSAPDTASRRYAFAVACKDATESAHQYLESVTTGERVSFQQFKE